MCVRAAPGRGGRGWTVARFYSYKYAKSAKSMGVANAWLHHISVVAIADTYRPDVIHRDLVNGKTVPYKSEIGPVLYMPDVCDVRYTDGMRIVVTPQKATIGKDYDEPFEQCMDAEVHTLAAKFVKTYKGVSYRAIGLNWTISLPHDNPLQWMTRKFLKAAKSLSTNVSMVPQFVIKVDKAEIRLLFKPGEVEHDGQQRSVVVVNCNHQTGPFKAHTGVLNAVTGWKGARDTVLSSLGAVLK